jgi:hypothetical protein
MQYRKPHGASKNRRLGNIAGDGHCGPHAPVARRATF